MKRKLEITDLIQLAKEFCTTETHHKSKELYGTTDGKAVGTYIEQKFKSYLQARFEVVIGNAANGIDLPSSDINTDIKVTSAKQPQSSSPFKNAQQKIFGLGYNLLLFVYDKKDDDATKTAILDFVSCTFIEKERTADYTTTFRLVEMLKDHASAEDIFAYLSDKNIPADETTLVQLSEKIIAQPPVIGYLTISNALQWRLQYGRVVNLSESIDGIVKIIDKVNYHESIWDKTTK